MVKNGILHVHSMYSINDSTQTPEEIVKRAKELGCEHITLTDHGTLLGIDSFMEAGEKHGINTIPGVETYLDNRQHLVLIAKNYEGFQLISKGIREANTHQYIRKIKGKSMVFPIMTKEILELFKDSEDVIATSACIQGPIASILLRSFYMQKEIEKLKKKQDVYKESFTELFDSSEEAYKKICHDITVYKKDKTAFVKYTKEPYKQITEDKKNKIDKINEKLNDSSNLSKSKMLSLQTKKENLETEVKKREELTISAKNTVDYSNKKIEMLEKQKEKWKAIRDEHKSKKIKYEKIEEVIKKIHIESREDLYEEAIQTVKYYKNIFHHFFIELQYHGLEEEKIVMPLLLKIAKETNTPIIAANDAHMKDGTENSIIARQIVRYNYFSKHQKANDADRTLYLKSDEELLNSLCLILPKEDVLEAIENTKILKECKVIFPNEKHYPVCKSKETFRGLLDDARNQKIKAGLWNEIYEERLNHEIEVIENMGFVDYHMVVRDFCIAGRKLGVVPKNELDYMPIDYEKALEWIKTKNYTIGIGVGPGRGSAAGSLVCYLLGITNIDPIRYGLLFERFLNPERVTMPDIDTDIKTSLRPYLIRYVKQVYGERSVCSIMTENTYAAKASIQMVGRDRADELYGDLSNPEQKEKKSAYLKTVRKITDLLPDNAGYLSVYDEMFKQHFQNNAEAMLLWNRAKLIEGRVSSTGIHAGGIVISDNDDINEYVPLAWKEDKKVWAAQRDMIRIEAKGLLKMDLLGLNTLDCNTDCLHLIEKNYGIAINIDEIPFEPAVFKEIYSKGHTNSIFQFESSGMKQMLKDFMPNCIEDIILLVAAYRPGPMEFLPNLIDIKHGRKPLTYLTPELEPILSSTYGQIIYQEQVMQIFQQLAGYSLGQADLVRRAMSKKKEEKLLIERNAFVYGDPERNIIGCKKNGINNEKANRLFDDMIDFAKYAFNKSHAAAYAIVSYQTAWLKYHYTKEFLCAMFNNKDSDDYAPIIEDCNYYKIELLPPDINYSFFEFTTENSSIRYGFKGIKDIADNDSISEIIKKRSGKRNQKLFQDYIDFVERFLSEDNEKCNLFEKRLMDALIKSGCFDAITPNRIALYETYIRTNFKQSYNSIISYYKNNIGSTKKIDAKILRQWEVEYMKFYLRENPLKEYHDDSYYGCVSYNELVNGKVKIFGLVTSVESKISKNGNKMLIVDLQGKTGKTTVLFFREKCERYSKLIDSFENTVVIIEGNCSEGTIFGNSIEKLEPNRHNYYYICDSIEKYKILLQEVVGTKGLEELNIFTFYKGIDESNIQELDKPIMIRVAVTKQVIKKIGAKREK